MTDGLFTRRFVLATLGNLVFFVGVTSFFSLPVHLEALGASRAEIGRVMGSFGLASLFAMPLTGVLVDRFGRRGFMVLGSLVFSVLSLGFLAVGGIGPLVYALRLGQGLAFSLAFVATNALIVDLAPRGGLGRAIALFGATTLISHAVGPAFGEWVAHHFGFPRLFQLSALAALGAAGAHALAPGGFRAQPAHVERPTGLLGLALRRGASGALFSAVGSAVTFGAAINFMPVFVRSRGLPSHAPFFVAYVLAAIAIRLGAGGASDRFGHRRVGTIASLGFAATAVGFAFMGNRVASLVGLALVFGLSHGLAYPATNALFVEGAPPNARGRAMAVFNLAFNVGITLSAFVAGEIAERAGYFAMWLVAAAASVAGSVLLALDRAPVTALEDRA